MTSSEEVYPWHSKSDNGFHCLHLCTETFSANCNRFPVNLSLEVFTLTFCQTPSNFCYVSPCRTIVLMNEMLPMKQSEHLSVARAGFALYVSSGTLLPQVMLTRILLHRVFFLLFWEVKWGTHKLFCPCCCCLKQLHPNPSQCLLGSSLLPSFFSASLMSFYMQV